ncbi:peptidoglycan-binding protein [Sporolactobacillus vineae]|uniref:peptidoglycan-binding protein n=1 Tax=Sporolactobacillus vineae TaxID=444463 RepID=UPI0002890F0A|nr:peptidoglycan-binding protein [Sporolactobacillus vineae]
MYYGSAIAKSAAIAATFSSSFLFMPHDAAAQLIQSDRILTNGMNSEEVLTLQRVLKANKLYQPFRPTGHFGNATEGAVRQFQKLSGITIDGVVGQETKKALLASVHRNMAQMQYGSTGEDVRYLQKYLDRFGYYKGARDGIFGRMTRHAVLWLQQDTKIERDGIVGPETWGSIEKLSQQLADGKHVKPTGAPPGRSAAAAGRGVRLLTKHTERVSAPAPSVQQQHSVSAKRQARQTVKHASVKEFYVSSTAYTANCSGCSGTTATGINLLQHPNARVVAVDPSVIPLGTKLYVEGYGQAVAGDTGGAIKGLKIDVFLNNNQQALQWGRRTVKVRVLE